MKVLLLTNRAFFFLFVFLLWEVHFLVQNAQAQSISDNHDDDVSSSSGNSNENNLILRPTPSKPSSNRHQSSSSSSLSSTSSSNDLNAFARAAATASTSPLSSSSANNINYNTNNYRPRIALANNCPLRCLCFQTTVRCMFLQLEKIPHIPEDTTILDLRFNQIRDIPPNSFQNLAKLDTLLLNNNHISRLRNGAFNGLSNLKFLYLYKNRIRDIESHVFQNLSNLEQLYLHYNFINEIEPETFSRLTKLERLFLHNNRIQRIPHGSFDDLSLIRRLRLDSNALVCDCGMVSLAQMLVQHPDTLAAAICQQPVSMQGKPITALQEMNLHCRKPSITEEPRDVEINFGNTVYFSCKADGDPLPNIVWYKNSNQINPSTEPRYSVMNDGTLMIANAQDQDTQGVYECMAKSSSGFAKSRSAKIKYKKSVNKIRPRFIQVPSDQDVLEGKNILLNCEVFGVPEPQISWMLNDQTMSFNSRHEISSKGSLTIYNALKTDGGIYRCTATNSVGRVASIAEVRIQVPPVWLTTPLDRSVQIGSTLELECDATENPIITWIHNGQNLLADNRKSTSNQGRQLSIRNVIQEDEGEYTCRAENSAGILETNANIRVIGGTLPVFTRQPLDSVINVRVGHRVQLDCSASGYPIPAIIWRRGHLTIIENSRYTILPSGTLIINRFNADTDGGTYECVAFNDYGVITSEPIRLESNRARPVGRERIDDAFLFNAINQARRDVELAENETLALLFGNMTKMEIRSPVDLLRLARFPKPEGRDIARSAEIYERTLQIVSKHVSEGMNFSMAGDYSYNDLLSPTQLETLGRFSGCISHRKPKRNCTLDMCFHTRYRSIDGSCNNFGEPMWGMSYTPFQRLLKSEYENGFNLPIGWTPTKLYNGFPKPYARHISNQIIRTETVTPDLVYTHMLMQWGQFLDHDLDHALPSLSIESFGERVSCRRTCENVAPCFPMKTPENDARVRTRKCMEFTRSAAVCGSGVTSILFDTIQQREQINQLTAYIDASQVYGSSEEELRSLRSKTEPSLLLKGIYMSHNKPLMPFATDDTPVDCRRDSRESDVGCFLGGDIRVNEQLGLLAMHTVWFRQHNFIAGKLKDINSNWEDEVVFQEARKIVGAQMQHITYAHWLPLVVGQRGMRELGRYQGYDPQVNPTITTEFATAALRFGHTLINPVLRRLDENFQSIREGDLPLRSAFFAPWRLVEEGGLDPIIRGLFATAAKLKKPQELLNSHLTEDLFTHAHIVALDLASMNIQRGRDHGIPSYNEYRVLCNLSRAYDFDDLQIEIPNLALRRKLEEVYKHVDNIDLWVGGVAEDAEDSDARVGPTFRCILVNQFRALRDGDRFWYENPSAFRSEQLIQIKQTTLARVLCDTGDSLLHIKRDVFNMDSELLRCEVIPSMQVAFWASNCCDGGSRPSFNSATCPALSLISSNRESNQITNIRRRRHSRHRHKDSESLENGQLDFVNPKKKHRHSKREISNNQNNSSAIIYNSSNNSSRSSPKLNFITLERLEATLSIVKSTVSALKSRIDELESKCENDKNVREEIKN